MAITSEALPLARARARYFAGIATAGFALLALGAVGHTRWVAYLAIPGLIWVLYQTVDAADPLALRLVAFACAHGAGLLWWDWLLAGGRGTLVYPHDGVLVVRSPVYMPFAWAVTLAPIFVLASTRADRLPRVVAVESAFYAASELLAVRAGWWSYGGAPAIAGIPVAVLAAYPLWLAVSTRLALRVARAEVSLVAAIAGALAWTTAATTLTWAVAVVPFR